MKEITAIFIGRAGSGKGTQASLLKKYIETQNDTLPVVYLEAGALFREFVNGNLFSQKLAFDTNKTGGLQPEFLAINLWSNFLIKNIDGNPVHIIIDGSPRKINEAIPLDSALQFYKRVKTYIFYLDTSREEVTTRLLKRGRVDDTHEGIEKRLGLFDTDVTKSIEFFRSNPAYNFCDINGEQTIEAVHTDILKAISA